MDLFVKFKYEYSFYKHALIHNNIDYQERMLRNRMIANMSLYLITPQLIIRLLRLSILSRPRTLLSKTYKNFICICKFIYDS